VSHLYLISDKYCAVTLITLSPCAVHFTNQCVGSESDILGHDSAMLHYGVSFLQRWYDCEKFQETDIARYIFFKRHLQSFADL
jgi:hypothetical protein